MTTTQTDALMALDSLTDEDFDIDTRKAHTLICAIRARLEGGV